MKVYIYMTRGSYPCYLPIEGEVRPSEIAKRKLVDLPEEVINDYEQAVAVFKTAMDNFLELVDKVREGKPKGGDGS